MLDLSISVVTFNNKIGELKKLLDCLLNTHLNKIIFVIDNSPYDAIGRLCKDKDILYIFNRKNIGFGAAHNLAIKKVIDSSIYHLVLNPDIYFEKGTLEEIYGFMERRRDIGLVMPKVLYPEGTDQYLCRLLPAPFDLLIRRARIPFFSQRLDYTHALKFTGYKNEMEVPYLSGCFMFIRSEVFKKVGLFDERFFMYMEDVDFSRRISRFYKNVFYPKAIIYHECRKDSYANLLSLKYHVKSAVSYFNKWGWFKDRERQRINRAAIDSFRKA